MIPFACPTCRCGLQALDDEVGRMIACPRCRGPVQVPVPINRGGSNSTVWIILAVVGAGFVGLMMLIVVVVGAIAAIGSASNATFTNVSAAIGPGSMSSADFADPEEDVLIPDDMPLEPIEEVSEPINRAAERAALAFLKDIKEGKEENAYLETTPSFQGRHSLNEFRENLQDYPMFRSSSNYHLRPAPTKTKGVLIYKGWITGRMGKAKFTLTTVQTDDGWQVNEFIIE